MRFLDRTIGVAVLKLLAVGRRHKPLPADPRRIGVIIPTAIGDTILSSGVISALRDKYPEASLVIFHSASNASAVELVPVKVTPRQCSFNNPLRAISVLRRERLDMIVDLTPWPRITAICARLAAPIAIGFDPPGQHRGSAFDIAVRHLGDVHELDNHARLAALFSSRSYRMNIRPRRFDAPKGVELDRLVLCHVSAGGSRAADKAWPADRWAELTRRLVAEGWQVGFTGTHADASAVDAVLASASVPRKQAFSLCGMVALDQLADLVKRAALLITIDTGVLHLGAAVDASMIGLHGPTRSARWGARNPNATSLESDHPAGGYIMYGYETSSHGRETMLSHRVDDVASLALNKLRQLAISPVSVLSETDRLIAYGD